MYHFRKVINNILSEFLFYFLLTLSFFSRKKPAKGGEGKEKVEKGTMIKRGPFKYSHTQLEKDMIITESEVPEER